MLPTQTSQKFIPQFFPEHWSLVQKFLRLMGSPFDVKNPELVKGVLTVENHMQKFYIIAEIAKQLQPYVVNDRAELEENGYTSNINSHKFAALIETLFCELYSCLDGIRRTIHGVYGNKVEGVQNKSTKNFFERANNKKYGSDFPEVIRICLDSAYTSWFPRLRKIRTEVTHGEVGMCDFEPNTGLIRYIHYRLGSNTQGFVIEDIITELKYLSQEVFQLVEIVFNYLYSQLEPIDKKIPCGIYKGRFYERIVIPEKDLSFNSGKCLSMIWFEKDKERQCPMREECGAYKNAKIASK